MTPPPAQAQAAARAWAAMHAFVMANDRNSELQEALGLGRGTGRVKVLRQLLSGPATLRDIAEANHVDPPYATVIVDKLVALGLAQRADHPDGRRRKLVSLTTAGQQAAQQASRILLRPPDSLAALPPADLHALNQVLSQLEPASTG